MDMRKWVYTVGRCEHMQCKVREKKSTLSKRDSRGVRSGLVEGEGTAVLEDEAVRESWKIGLRAQQQQLEAVLGQLAGLAKAMEEVVTATRRHCSHGDRGEQGKRRGQWPQGGLPGQTGVPRELTSTLWV